MRAFGLKAFTAADARNILAAISEEDCIFLGLPPGSRPETMIITHLVIPPPIIRPTIFSFEGSRSASKDGLTQHLQAIMAQNVTVKEAMKDDIGNALQLSL